MLDRATDQLRFRRIRRIMDLAVWQSMRIHLEKIRESFLAPSIRGEDTKRNLKHVKDHAANN
jgi:hypothetical protein